VFLIMGYDIEEETVRVLEHGFDGPPASLGPSQTAPFAVWVREPYGAVFFIRRWRDGTFDTDCAITERAPDGSWEYPQGHGGGGWCDPFDRPPDGWDGDPLVWGGEVGRGVGDDPWVSVNVAQAMASPVVKVLEVLDFNGAVVDVVRVRDDTGVVIVGLVGEGTHTVVARGADGAVVRDASGREIRDVFEPEDDDHPRDVMEMLYDAAGGPVIGAVGTDADGRWFVDAGDRGRRVIDDPDLAARFEKNFRDPAPRPRRIG
jgi:hypothetical protein